MNRTARDNLRTHVARLLNRYRYSRKFGADCLPELASAEEAARAVGRVEEAAALQAAATELGARKSLKPEHGELLKQDLLSLQEFALGADPAYYAKALAWLIGIVASVLTILKTMGLFSGQAEEAAEKTGDPKQLLLVYAIQISVIALIFWDVQKKYARTRRMGSSFEDRVIRQFTGYYRYLWLCWLALYGALIARSHYPSVPATALVELLNNLTAFFFLMCFAILDLPSIELKKGDNRDRSFRNVRTAALGAALVCTAISLAICLQPEGAQIRDEWYRASRLPSGILTGLATCFFIGRIDSRFLDINRFLIGGLYIFAIIQVAWPIIDEPRKDLENVDGFPVVIIQLFLLASLLGKIFLSRAIDHMYEREEYAFRSYITGIRRFVDMAREELSGEPEDGMT